MWVESAGKKVSFCLIILARLAADTLSAKTRPRKFQFVPGPPISLYEVRGEVVVSVGLSSVDSAAPLLSMQ